MDTESAGTSALRLRAESALRALAEGRRRLAHGVTAVAQPPAIDSDVGGCKIRSHLERSTCCLYQDLPTRQNLA